jgi:aminoglycoside phosphotransferase (APT) family kinase protein
VRRLVDAGILDAENVLDGGVSVTDLSRSNEVSLVRVDGQAQAVAKHVSVPVDEIDPFDAELAAYRFLAAEPETSAIAPRLLVAFPGDRALVLEAIDGAQSLHEAIAASPDSAEPLLAALGRLLAVLHGARCAASSGLAPRRPWVLGLAEGRAPAMLAGNAAAASVIDRIARHAGLRAAIAELDRVWVSVAPIHGDVKFDNVLVAGAPGAHVWLVDWELAGQGDPAWDLAGVVDGLLLPLLVGGAGARPHSAGGALGLAAPAIDAHRLSVGTAASPVAERLALAVAARLAQTAVQLAAMSDGEADARVAAERVVAAAGEVADDVVPAGACRA